MKNTANIFKIILPWLGSGKATIPLAALLLLSFAGTAPAQGTVFTYQGQLQKNGSPASGTYNLTFSLFNTNTSGVAIAGPVTNTAVHVTDGLFMVLIDFGPGAFTGATNWLEIAVETNGVNTFTTLTPRQQLTPTPIAIYAESASDLSGTLLASQLTSIGNVNGGSANFFVGPSGNSWTTGGANTANGFQALQNNASGGANTANGSQALQNNTSGFGNTANGCEALCANTNGSYNTANGNQALYSNTSGSQNTAAGSEALASNTGGFFNTADGNQALFFNTTGWGNTANGNQALFSLTNGSFNTADGYRALYSNTSGSENIALGDQAGLNITSGSLNIDIGNPGVAGDNNIIRIGSGQSHTFIAGILNGNGSGLTDLQAASLVGSVANNQLANNSIIVSAGTGLSGGGMVALGGSTTLNNAGVLSVTGNSDITASTVGGAVTLGDNATSGNTPATIVKRDASGNFSAGTITASDFVGSGAGLTSAGLLKASVLNVNAVGGVAFSTTYVKVGNLGSFTKLQAGSTIEITFDGRLSALTMSGTGAIFELRIDDTASTVGWARATLKSSQAGNDGGQSSITGIFTGLGTGSHTVNVWVQGAGAGGTKAYVAGGNYSTDHVVVKELK